MLHRGGDIFTVQPGAVLGFKNRDQWGHNFKWGAHPGHMLIITVDPNIGLTSN